VAFAHLQMALVFDLPESVEALGVREARVLLTGIVGLSQVCHPGSLNYFRQAMAKA